MKIAPCLLPIVVLAAAILIVVPSSSPAAPCAQPAVQRSYAPYKAPAYYYPPATILIYPPSYYVGISHPDADLLERLESLKLQLERLESQRPEVRGQRSELNGSQVLVERCAACHTGANPKGGFRLDLTGFASEDKARAIEQVLAGAMPPRGGLPDAERKAVLRALVK